MVKRKLSDVYYSACMEYSSYLQSGIISFKEKADKLIEEYKTRGGKKELKYIK